jgi:nicotinamide-nucleotide amidase
MHNQLAAQIIDRLRSQGRYLVIAESLTGGQLSSIFVSVPGASDVLLGGVVAYQTKLKNVWLGVDLNLLESRGAVDAEVARQMAAGAVAKSAEDLDLEPQRIIGLSTTGVAGPAEQNGQPVGRVFIGLSTENSHTAFEYAFSGTREEIRRRSSEAAVSALWEQIR